MSDTANKRPAPWNCGDCGNMYDDEITSCPNVHLDAAILKTKAKDPDHDPLCPRFRLVCECSDCYPPDCLCKVIDAVRRHDGHDLRLATYADRRYA